MKRSLSLLISTLCLGLTLHAQSTDTTVFPAKKPNPAKQAVHQLKMLQQQLNLSEDQVTQLQVILIQRDVALDSLRNNPSGDHRSDGRTRRGINQNADQKINAMLTADQRPLYQQWKQQQREKYLEKRQGNPQP
jgi:Spy/CpxP family protein refolding chaperone